MTRMRKEIERFRVYLRRAGQRLKPGLFEQDSIIKNMIIKNCIFSLNIKIRSRNSTRFLFHFLLYQTHSITPASICLRQSKNVTSFPITDKNPIVILHFGFVAIMEWQYNSNGANYSEKGDRPHEKNEVTHCELINERVVHFSSRKGALVTSRQ